MIKRKEVKEVMVKLKSAILFSLLCLVMSMTMIIPLAFAEPIKVKPNPLDLAGVHVNDVFPVNILLSPNPLAECIVAWELEVTWSPCQNLIVVDVDEGNFLSSVGVTHFVWKYDVIGCRLIVAAILLGTSTGACDVGTLATITFQCMSGGPTSIYLSSVLLDPSLTLIEHTDKDGHFNQGP